MNILTQKVEELILGLMCKECKNFLIEKEMFIKTEEVKYEMSQGAVFGMFLKPCSCKGKENG